MLAGAEPAEPQARSAGDPARRALIGLCVVLAAGGLLAAFTFLGSEVSPRRALELASVRGPAPGTWELQEAHGTRRREFAEDPADPDRLLCALQKTPQDPVQRVSLPRDVIARRVFSEAPPELFFANYRARSRRSDRVADRRVLRWEFVCVGMPPPAPTRQMWVDDATGELVQLEDKAYDGALVHAARWTTRATEVLDRLRDARVELSPGARRCCRSLESVVAAAPFPVYEPTWLPGGFRRVVQELVEWSDGTAEVSVTPRGVRMRVPKSQIVIVRYSDGLARMDLMMAPPEHMKRFEASLRGRKISDASACPDSFADGPEELLATGDKLLVRRRADRCRTTLKMDDLGGVTVVLVGRNELAPQTYVSVIESLAAVPGSKRLDDKKPIEDWMEPASDGGVVPPGRVEREDPAPRSIPANGDRAK